MTCDGRLGLSGYTACESNDDDDDDDGEEEVRQSQ